MQGGESDFYFWANGIKYTKTTTQSTVIPNVTGTYYVYFDNSGNIQNVIEGSMPLSVIYENAIVCLVYWNATAGSGMLGDERHGIRMSAATHGYNHLTFGARYDDSDGAMDITGLSSGGATYTNTTAGHFWDEDIRHNVALQTTHKFLYRLGATGEWTQTAAANTVSYKDGADTYHSWNEWTGSTWQLTEGTSSTDYWIIFYVTTPDVSGSNIKKIIGQNAYSSRNNARAAIETEIRALNTGGLPNPEMLFLYATIVRRNGTLQTLDGGSDLYLDLRYTKGVGGSTGNSLTVFSDLNFNIYDDTDPTKIMDFQLSGLTTGNTRTVTMPDKSGTMAMTSDITGGGGSIENEVGNSGSIADDASGTVDLTLTNENIDFNTIRFWIETDPAESVVSRKFDVEVWQTNPTGGAAYANLIAYENNITCQTGEIQSLSTKTLTCDDVTGFQNQEYCKLREVGVADQDNMIQTVTGSTGGTLLLYDTPTGAIADADFVFSCYDMKINRAIVASSTSKHIYIKVTNRSGSTDTFYCEARTVN